MTDKIVVISTCGSEEEAVRVAKHLVDARIAACVNLIPKIRSIYRWQGKLEDTPEWMLVIKTSRPRFDALRDALAAAHSYEIPEIIALPIVDGSPDFLAWLDTELDSGVVSPDA
jgi:periplasmic divalent cation tolerance protein